MTFISFNNTNGPKSQSIPNTPDFGLEIKKFHNNLCVFIIISVLLYLLHTAWKVPNTEFPNTPYLSVFSPNAGNYGPEKTPYLDTFHAVLLSLHKSFVYPPFTYILYQGNIVLQSIQRGIEKLLRNFHG